MTYKLPVVDMIATGRNIEKLMLERGLSVRDIQEILEFSSNMSVYKWLYGRSLPTIDNLMRLAVILNVSVETIIVVEEGYEVKH